MEISITSFKPLVLKENIICIYVLFLNEMEHKKSLSNHLLGCLYERNKPTGKTRGFKCLEAPVFHSKCSQFLVSTKLPPKPKYFLLPPTAGDKVVLSSAVLKSYEAKQRRERLCAHSVFLTFLWAVWRGCFPLPCRLSQQCEITYLHKTWKETK